MTRRVAQEKLSTALARVRAEKVIYTPNYFGKEKGREKETFPPAPPIEKKGSQKKQSPVFLNPDILSPRGRARTSEKAPRVDLPAGQDMADKTRCREAKVLQRHRNAPDLLFAQ
jgi:hypothetical protein